MRTQAQIAAAANLLALRALRTAASIPRKAQRLPALTQMLAATDQKLAQDFSRSYDGGTEMIDALRYAYGQYLGRQLTARGMGMGSYYAQTQYSPWGAFSLGDAEEVIGQVTETARQVGEAAGAVTDAASSVIEGIGNVYGAITSFGSGSEAAAEEEARRLDIPLMPSTVQFHPASVQGRFPQAATAAGTAVSTLPSWVLPVGAAAGAFAAWKLFFAKKKRQGAKK